MLAASLIPNQHWYKGIQSRLVEQRIANPMSQVLFQTTSKDGNARMLEQPEEREIHMEDKSAAHQINAILKKYDDWRGEMLSRLRALIKQADPALVEEVKRKKPGSSPRESPCGLMMEYFAFDLFSPTASRMSAFNAASLMVSLS